MRKTIPGSSSIPPCAAASRPSAAPASRWPTILRLLEDGDTEATLVADFPPLTLADVRACRAYAAATGLAPTRGHWIDKVAGTLDEDFARAALDRPGPESYQRPDISLD